MDKKKFIKRIFLVFFPGNSIRIYINNDVIKAKIKNFKGKEIILISPKYPFKIGDVVNLESIFEGAYYEANFIISQIMPFGENEVLLIMNLNSNFKIKSKRGKERLYISIPVKIEDKYNGLLWDLNDNFLGVITLNEYISDIKKNIDVKLEIEEFNIIFEGSIFKIRQEFFNLSKIIYEIKIIKDPTGLFGKYIEHISGEDIFEEKKSAEVDNNE
ncbi:hypothetical protein [Marinitoga sp. 38H-ov]|uniref:hypothetical protein n=1 Tax=Marinitoga sp. 38H-ov TaxID=1755814 RepID=UPI0013EDAF9D|nr:hypothetical protein [Marinitoga sp. 38H-ov]KAF2956476.1 hypothetical protein AS160_05450 [Marinitoga sp. 38H-ov]